MSFDSLLDQIGLSIPLADFSNESVSAANVGWHLEHSMLVLNNVILAAIRSDPSKYKWKFSGIRSVLFLMGKFPRGRAQSPQSVRPKEFNDVTALDEHLAKTRKYIQSLDSIDEGKYFEHPLFGQLKGRQLKRFLKLHTKHHLVIVSDILENRE